MQTRQVHELAGIVMSCPTDADFEQFAADQLTAATEHRIAEHLEACETCRQRAEAVCAGDDLHACKKPPRGDADATQKESHGWRADLYRLVDDQRPSPPMSEPNAELFRLLTAEPTDDIAGTRLSHFTVRCWLGAGAFGVVFLADDQLLHRQVALKLPRIQPMARREVRERFLREAEVAAQLHHPNVVPVYEAGQEHGICYIASSYCSGPTLAAWLDSHEDPVPVATAVTLVRQLAEAVQHAHEHRVLHRDIKPSNILLEASPTVPGTWTPMITDFGLAKLLGPDIGGGDHTGSQGMLGTPRYMAPEQATGRRDAIVPATDVFSLGAVLYELLVKTAPFAGEDQAETLHRLLHQQPVLVRRQRLEIPRDLEAICLKCLEKDPKDRYPTAQALADDLRRFQEGHATAARPIRWPEKLRRWTVRQPTVAAMVALIATGLMGLLTITIAYNRSLESLNQETQSALRGTRRAQRALESQQARLRNLLYVSEIGLAHQAIEENDLRQASRLLREIRAETPDLADGFVWRHLYNRVAAPAQTVASSENAVYIVQFSPGADRVAIGGADGILRMHDGATFEPIFAIPTDQKEINAIVFSPDGQRLATAGDDGTIRFWDARDGRPQHRIAAHSGFAYGVLFYANGERLVSYGREPVVRLWDVRSGEPRGTLEADIRRVESIALAPDGTQLASAGSDGRVRIWDLDSQRLVRVLDGHQKRVTGLAYSPDGNWLLSGSLDHTVRLWQPDNGKCLQIEEHVDAIDAVTFLDGDRQLVVGDRGGAVHIWQRRTAGDGNADPSTSNLIRSWKAHEGRVWNVTAAADGTALITTGADGRVRYWQRPMAVDASLTLTSDEEIQDIAFDRNSSRLLFIGSGQNVQAWDLRGNRAVSHGKPSGSETAPRRPLAIDALPGSIAGRLLSDGTIDGVQVPSQEKAFQLATPWEPSASYRLDDVAASDDGRRLAAFSYGNDAALVYDIPQRRLLGTFASYSMAMALSGDGEQLAMSDGDDVVVWDVDQQRLAERFSGHSSSVVTLRFSPDGRWLASGSKDRSVRLWQLGGQAEAIILDGHRDEVETLAFSPDGRLLVSGDRRGELKFWHLAEHTELLTMDGFGPIQRVLFSPDGNRLAIQTAQHIHLLTAAGVR